MAFTKITNADLLNKGVVGLPDTPNLSTTEMQEKFDEIARDVIVPKHNALIDELADIGAALNIGAVDPLGNPSTVQEQLNRQSESGYTKAEADMKFVAQEVGKQLSTEDFTTAEKDKLANLENYVLPLGTDTTLGGVKADNTTFTIDSNGVGHAIGGGGGGGTTDYNALVNKPKINNVEVIGNKSLDDFGIAKDTLVEITVTYDTPVIGATLTCSNGTEVYTFTADSSLSHTFMCKSLGMWTVSEDAQGTSVEVEAVYYGRYSCVVGGDIAIVVNFGADMVGQTITCAKDGFSKSKTASGSSISFALADEGTYTISETLNSTSSTVTVTHGNTYTVDFKASIQVSIPDTDIGNTITCSDGTHTYTWVSDSTTHTFEVSKKTTWTISNPTIGVSQTVSVTDFTSYSVSIGGATIELTVSSDFIGETITCTNGTITKTWECDTTTHTFTVGLGTWTISATVSGQTYSTSVVVSSYTTYSATLETDITLNLTVYSAVSDTVFYYPNNDTTENPITLCTTDSSGQGSGTITIPSAGTSITFYSTVAKDTTDGSTNYSKSVSLTNETSVLYVMPNGVIYWYGYEKYALTTTTPSYVTKNTNYTEVKTHYYISSGQFKTIVTSDKVIDLTGYTQISSMYKATYVGGNTKTLNLGVYKSALTSTENNCYLWVQALGQNNGIMKSSFAVLNGQNVTLGEVTHQETVTTSAGASYDTTVDYYAIWLE